MNFFYLIFLFTLIQADVPEDQPSITNITENQMIKIGHSVNLHCSLKNADRMIVRWIKMKDHNGQVDEYPANGQYIVSEGLLSHNHNKYVITYNKKTATYVLKIKDFEQSDGGVYRCVVYMNSEKRIEARTILTAARTPVIYSYSPDLASREGDTTEFECRAEGPPAPEILWWREKNIPFSDGAKTHRQSKIIIPVVSRYDDGMYYCQADNGFDLSKIRNVTLRVMFPPSVTSLQEKLSSKRNFPIHLKCKIDAFPIPKIIWTRDDEQLNNTDKQPIVISNDFISKYTIITNLRISLTELNHFGRYSCIASNDFGRNGANIDVSEMLIK